MQVVWGLSQSNCEIRLFTWLHFCKPLAALILQGMWMSLHLKLFMHSSYFPVTRRTMFWSWQNSFLNSTVSPYASPQKKKKNSHKLREKVDSCMFECMAKKNWFLFVSQWSGHSGHKWCGFCHVQVGTFKCANLSNIGYIAGRGKTTAAVYKSVTFFILNNFCPSCGVQFCCNLWHWAMESRFDQSQLWV